MCKTCGNTCSDAKNDAIAELEAFKLYPGTNLVPQTAAIEDVANSKNYSPGQLPNFGKEAKKPISFLTGAAIAVGAVLIFYLAIRFKLLKV